MRRPSGLWELLMIAAVHSLDRCLRPRGFHVRTAKHYWKIPKWAEQTCLKAPVKMGCKNYSQRMLTRILYEKKSKSIKLDFFSHKLYMDFFHFYCCQFEFVISCAIVRCNMFECGLWSKKSLCITNWKIRII